MVEGVCFFFLSLSLRWQRSHSETEQNLNLTAASEIILMFFFSLSLFKNTPTACDFQTPDAYLKPSTVLLESGAPQPRRWCRIWSVKADWCKLFPRSLVPSVLRVGNTFASTARETLWMMMMMMMRPGVLDAVLSHLNLNTLGDTRCFRMFEK